jgi:hypothetical protein
MGVLALPIVDKSTRVPTARLNDLIVGSCSRRGSAPAFIFTRFRVCQGCGIGMFGCDATELNRLKGRYRADGGNLPRPPPFPVHVSKAPHRPLCAALSF